jgi:hypothetical protein
MRISRTYRPELAAEAPDLYLDAKAARLIAIDEKVILALPVAVAHGERSGHVAREAVRAAWRGSPANEETAYIRATPLRHARAVEWRNRLPTSRRGQNGMVSLTVKIDALERLATAMGADAVTLTVAADYTGGPIVVEPIGTTADVVGLLRQEEAGNRSPPRVALRPGATRTMRITKRTRRDLEAAADAILSEAGSEDLVDADLR